MKIKGIIIFFLIIFFLFTTQIFADSDNVISIDDILNKVEQLSRFTFNVDMYFIRTFDENFSSYSPYLIINTGFIYNFSDFTTLVINYNLGQNGKIDLDNFDTNNFTEMDINEFSVFEDLAKLFNFNKMELNVKIGYFNFDSSIIKRNYQILDGGYTKFTITYPMILSHFQYGMFSINIANMLYNENALAQLKFNLLNLLTFGFEIFAESDQDLIYNIQILFKYINFYIYSNITPFQTTISGINTLQANLSFRANYSFGDIIIGKFDLGNFYLAAFYESLDKNSFNGYLISQNFSRTGGEFGLSNKWYNIALCPYYIASSDKFYVDGLIRIKLANIYIEVSSNHSPLNGIDVGYFLKVGTKIN